MCTLDMDNSLPIVISDTDDTTSCRLLIECHCVYIMSVVSTVMTEIVAVSTEMFNTLLVVCNQEQII